MIKITNKIDGKLYELVPKEPHDCNECAFNGEYDCTIPKEHRYHYGHLACLRYCGIWKEVKDEKTT